MMLKLDIEKAYDHLHWPFLFQILQHYSFHDGFLGWVKALMLKS